MLNSPCLWSEQPSWWMWNSIILSGIENIYVLIVISYLEQFSELYIHLVYVCMYVCIIWFYNFCGFGIIMNFNDKYIQYVSIYCSYLYWCPNYPIISKWGPLLFDTPFQHDPLSSLLVPLLSGLISCSDLFCVLPLSLQGTLEIVLEDHDLGAGVLMGTELISRHFWWTKER